MALWSTALVGSTPIGAPIIGALSDAVSPRFGILLGAVACVAAAVIGRWPARAGRDQADRLNAATAAPAAE
jgi:hypothetical protein